MQKLTVHGDSPPGDSPPPPPKVDPERHSMEICPSPRRRHTPEIHRPSPSDCNVLISRQTDINAGCRCMAAPRSCDLMRGRSITYMNKSPINNITRVRINGTRERSEFPHVETNRQDIDSLRQAASTKTLCKQVSK